MRNIFREVITNNGPFFGNRKFKARSLELVTACDPDEQYENEYELYNKDVDRIADAHVVTSATYTGKHMPVLDLDVEHYFVPSSTPGHAHLYINTECSWEDYTEFLRAAAKCGILEDNYVDVSIRKGYTAVRLPWVQRETPR